MRTFLIDIDGGSFQAADVDDAFARLGAYFTGMSENGLDTDSIFDTGHVRIRRAPIEDTADG